MLWNRILRSYRLPVSFWSGEFFRVLLPVGPGRMLDLLDFVVLRVVTAARICFAQPLFQKEKLMIYHKIILSITVHVRNINVVLMD